MGDNDPIWNCVLGVCCDALRAQEALAKVLTEYGVDANAAADCAKVMLTKFDLAPHGTLQPFKDAIAKHARGADYKP